MSCRKFSFKCVIIKEKADLNSVIFFMVYNEETETLRLLVKRTP